MKSKFTIGLSRWLSTSLNQKKMPNSRRSSIYYIYVCSIFSGRRIWLGSCPETEAFYQSNSPNELLVQSVPFGAT